MLTLKDQCRRDRAAAALHHAAHHGPSSAGAGASAAVADGLAFSRSPNGARTAADDLQVLQIRQLAGMFAPPVAVYSAPVGERSCNERVCVSVCLSVRDHVFGTTRPIFTNFLCMLPMVVALFSRHVTSSRFCG